MPTAFERLTAIDSVIERIIELVVRPYLSDPLTAPNRAERLTRVSRRLQPFGRAAMFQHIVVNEGHFAARLIRYLQRTPDAIPLIKSLAIGYAPSESTLDPITIVQLLYIVAPTLRELGFECGVGSDWELEAIEAAVGADVNFPALHTATFMLEAYDAIDEAAVPPILVDFVQLVGPAVQWLRLSVDGMYVSRAHLRPYEKILTSMAPRGLKGMRIWSLPDALASILGAASADTLRQIEIATATNVLGRLDLGSLHVQPPLLGVRDFGVECSGVASATWRSLTELTALRVAGHTLNARMLDAYPSSVRHLTLTIEPHELASIAAVITRLALLNWLPVRFAASVPRLLCRPWNSSASSSTTGERARRSARRSSTDCGGRARRAASASTSRTALRR